MTNEILVPAIIEAEITKARLTERPTPAQEMEAIARAILAIRYGRIDLRSLYRNALRTQLRRKG